MKLLKFLLASVFSAASAFAAGPVILHFDDVASMVAGAAPTAGDVAIVAGHKTIGDGGGGRFYGETVTLSTNAWSVFAKADADAVKWVRSGPVSEVPTLADLTNAPPAIMASEVKVAATSETYRYFDATQGELIPMRTFRVYAGSAGNFGTVAIAADGTATFTCEAGGDRIFYISSYLVSGTDYWIEYDAKASAGTMTAGGGSSMTSVVWAGGATIGTAWTKKRATFTAGGTGYTKELFLLIYGMSPAETVQIKNLRIGIQNDPSRWVKTDSVTMDDLRSAPIGITNKVVNVIGNHVAGDGGAGTFVSRGSSYGISDDGGTVAAYNRYSDVKWFREHEDVLSAEWFAVPTDGVTDATAILQAALNASTNRILRLEPKATYLVSQELSFDNVALEGQGARLFASGAGLNGKYILRADGSIGSWIKLANNIDRGQLYITNTALASAVAKGTLVKFYSTNVLHKPYALRFPAGELNRVLRVTGNVVEFDSPFFSSLTASKDLKATVVTPTVVSVKDLKLEYDSNYGGDGSGIYITYGDKPVVENVVGTHCQTQTISFADCHSPEALNCSVYYADEVAPSAALQNNYGITFDNATRSGRIIGGYLSGCRHHIKNGGNSAGGTVWDTRVIGVTMHKTYSSPTSCVDAHGNVGSISISDCTFLMPDVGLPASAVSSYAKFTEFRNSRIYGGKARISNVTTEALEAHSMIIDGIDVITGDNTLATFEKCTITNLVVRNITVEPTGPNSPQLRFANSSSFGNLEIENITSSKLVGIYFDNVNLPGSIALRGLDFAGDPGGPLPSASCIYVAATVTGLDMLTVSDSRMADAKQWISLNKSMKSVVFDDCWLSAQDNAVVMSAGVKVDQFTMRDCYIGDATAAGKAVFFRPNMGSLLLSGVDVPAGRWIALLRDGTYNRVEFDASNIAIPWAFGNPKIASFSWDDGAAPVTATQRNAVPASFLTQGLEVFNSTSGHSEVYDGSTWRTQGQVAKNKTVLLASNPSYWASTNVWVADENKTFHYGRLTNVVRFDAAARTNDLRVTPTTVTGGTRYTLSDLANRSGYTRGPDGATTAGTKYQIEWEGSVSRDGTLWYAPSTWTNVKWITGRAGSTNRTKVIAEFVAGGGSPGRGVLAGISSTEDPNVQLGDTFTVYGDIILRAFSQPKTPNGTTIFAAVDGGVWQSESPPSAALPIGNGSVNVASFDSPATSSLTITTAGMDATRAVQVVFTPPLPPGVLFEAQPINATSVRVDLINLSGDRVAINSNAVVSQ